MFKFNNSTFRALSNICNVIGQVFFGGFVALNILPIDFFKLVIVILDLLLAIGFWFLSIKFAEKGKL